MNRPVRLVISGYYGRGNLGDEGVLAGIVGALREVEPGAALTVISARPIETRAAHGVASVSHRDLVGIARAIRRSDGLVSGGGSLLHDQETRRAVPYYAGTILLARLLGRPVFVYAQGIGPLRSRHQRWLAGLALRAADYLSVRDDHSLAALRKLGVTARAFVVPDPALVLPHRGNAAHVTDRLVVSLRAWPGMEHWRPGLVAALDRLAGGFEIVLLPMHLPEDVAIAEAVASELAGAARVHVPEGMGDALDVIASADAVIGMRLHSLIFAAVSGRPFVAIPYDPKVTAFAEQLGQPIAADVRDSVDAARVERMVRSHVAADHSAYRERVAAMRDGAVTPAREILRLVRG